MNRPLFFCLLSTGRSSAHQTCFIHFSIGRINVQVIPFHRTPTADDCCCIARYLKLCNTSPNPSRYGDIIRASLLKFFFCHCPLTIFLYWNSGISPINCPGSPYTSGQSNCNFFLSQSLVPSRPFVTTNPCWRWPFGKTHFSWFVLIEPNGKTAKEY